MKCEHCLEELNADEDCQACCEHEFDPEEGYTCLNCGKDGYEELVCELEWRLGK